MIFVYSIDFIGNGLFRCNALGFVAAYKRSCCADVAVVIKAECKFAYVAQSSTRLHYKYVVNNFVLQSMAVTVNNRSELVGTFLRNLFCELCAVARNIGVLSDMRNSNNCIYSKL